MTVSGVPSTPSVGYGYSYYYDEENQMCMVDKGESYTVPFTMETPLPVSAAPPSPPPVRIDLGDPLECSAAARFVSGFGEGAVAVIKAPLAAGGCNPLGRVINEEDAGFDMVEAEVPDVPVDSDGDDLPDQPEILPDADADADTDEGINPDADADADVEIRPDVDADGDDIPDVIEDEVEPEDYVDGAEDGPVCTPFSFTDTIFTTGMPMGVVVSGDSISTPEDYSAFTDIYEGNIDPTTAGWTPNGAFVSPPDWSSGSLSFSTLGSNVQGNISTNPGFDDTIGGIVETRLKIDGLDDGTAGTLNSGFTLRVADGNGHVRFGFHNDQICEPVGAGVCYPDPPTSFRTTDYHTYRVAFRGGSYSFYVDGVLALSGSMGGSSDNEVRIGDQAAGPDGAVSIDYAYIDALGNELPHSSGSYTSSASDPSYNTGVLDYNFDNFPISWTEAPSSSGNVSIQARAANDIVSLEAAPWSAEITANPAILSAPMTGQYLQWRINLYGPNETIVNDVNGDRSCP
jgi:hypothetical protein